MEASIDFWGEAPRNPNGRFVNPAPPAATPVRVDPVRDALYRYDADAQKELNEDKPWARDVHFFTAVRVGALALAKMVMHARSGGELEVMGLMQGYVDGRTLVVTDAFRLPVEGTETRVNAQEEANEYLVEYLKRCRDQGRMENVIGWYHSHPGYGCWLSGIDVDTEVLQQQFGDPFVAVVIDPDRTISAGKVEIGAFRTYPENYKGPTTTTTMTDATGGASSSSDTSVPMNKAQDFGAHASRYYSLEVEHFKSQLDAHLLDLLWNKYWAQTLSQSPLLTNRDYDSKQMLDLAHRIRDVSKTLERAGLGGQAGIGGGGGGGGGALSVADLVDAKGALSSATKSGGGAAGAGGGAGGTAALTTANLGVKVLDDALGKVQRDSKRLAAREQAGLMAGAMKMQIFSAEGVSAETTTTTTTAATATAGTEDVEMATVPEV